MEIVSAYKLEVVEDGTIQVEGDGWTTTDLPYKIIARWEGRSVTYLEDSIKIYPDEDHLTEAGCAVMLNPRIERVIANKIYERHCKKADELNAMMPPIYKMEINEEFKQALEDRRFLREGEV